MAVLAGLVWVAVPAQAGPAYPAPTVTITTAPVFGQKLPQTLHAAWTIDRPGVEATLNVEGDVLVHTTVVALWTSAPHLIKHNQGSGSMTNYWAVTQAPIGKQSRQQVGGRMTNIHGKWDPWGYLPYHDTPYATASRGGTAQIFDYFYDGPTLPRGQEQYRLVLTLEPGTHVDEHSWNVSG
jgi:hypothetical protein